MNYRTAMIQLPLVKECHNSTIRTAEDVYDVCGDLRDLAQESVHVLCLDSKHHLLNRQLVTLGVVDASLVHPREVFREAVLCGASSLLVAHNHPSGDCNPSAEDVRITKQLIQAGKILDIKLLDHVIIGPHPEHSRSFLSMREEGICDFS